MNFKERHLSVADLATHFQLSTYTIRRLFRDEPGVIVIKNLAGKKCRDYETLRIPESVADRVYEKLQRKQMHRSPYRGGVR